MTNIEDKERKECPIKAIERSALHITKGSASKKCGKISYKKQKTNRKVVHELGVKD